MASGVVIVHPSSPPVELRKVSENCADLERDTSILVLTELVDRHGIETIARWLRNMAAGMGRDL